MAIITQGGHITFGPRAFNNQYSLDFDGVNEYVDCGTPPALVNVSNFSFSVWVKLDTDLGIIMGINAGSSNRTHIYINTGRKVLMNVSNGANTSGEISTAFALGTWVHIAGVFDGGGATNADRMKIYLNGTNETIAFTGTIPATTTNYTTERLTIGGFNGSLEMDGHTDEVAIFDYSLSVGNVTSIYNSGSPTDLNDLTTPPVHWWRNGDNDTYPTISDMGTVGGYDGTMTNMEVGDIVADVP